MMAVKIGIVVVVALFGFSQPIAGSSPASIFRLYTPGNVGPVTINTYLQRTFNPFLKTKIIVHGYLHYGGEQWVDDMRKELSKRERMNIITVDWGQGSGPVYSSAVQNSPNVGSEIAKLIHSIHKSHNYSISQVHVIGHSLGAHVAGFAGTEIQTKMAGKKIGRITGLDPAGPTFNHGRIAGRLDPSDADFVDVIHTDINRLMGLGLARRLGHVDFYPNGGTDQPGCVISDIFPQNLFTRILGLGSVRVTNPLQAICNHLKVIDFFTASINNNCSRKAVPCSSWQKYNHGRCKCDRSRDCAEMGYDADRYYRGRRQRLKAYLKTTQSEPFCAVQRNVYQVTLKDIYQSFRLFGGHSELQVFLTGRTGLAVSTLPRTKVKRSDKVLKITIKTKLNPGELESITIKYSGNLMLFVGRVTVQGPVNNYETSFNGVRLYSPHDYSSGRNRYKNYKRPLKKVST